MKKDIYERYKLFCSHYKLTGFKIKKLWNIIKPICYHEEFIKRCKPPFWHHDCSTLGDHIICDAIVTYKLVTNFKKKRKFFKFVDPKLAVYIAMFHDLYEEPWQNNLIFKTKHLKNKHGFIHPIEACANAITWFPEMFKDEHDALIIIDGIIHHMFPLPVRAVDDKPMELNNQDKFDALPEKYKRIIKSSTSIGQLGPFSLRKTFYIEGILMSKADKIVAIRKDMHSFRGLLALLTGNNKNLDEKDV